MIISNWTLRIAGDTPYIDRSKEIEAHVPGDITDDLFRAGLIPDPLFGRNGEKVRWITEQDFLYTATFDAEDELLSREEVLLSFDSVNLFSDIVLNGQFVGKTENMFLKYSFEVKNLLKRENNVLQVHMKSTRRAMEQIDCGDYFCIFNDARVFLRTQQCQFGWDWAPDMPGYGICGDVSLEGVSAFRIEDVTYRPRVDGKITFVAELNYSIRPMVDKMGSCIDGTCIAADGDRLEFCVQDAPHSDRMLKSTVSVSGKRNFVNMEIPNPQLWWPAGYGTQSMYEYEVLLYRGGQVVSRKTGRCALREVELVEEPKSSQLIGFEFKINGKKIFAKGSNWVPLDCFVGRVKEEKYKRLLTLAAQGNINMLRVWGGGWYERDVFYDTCDELGIMIWQDFMFACSDLPEHMHAWEKNALADCRYQIKRLRNHPSLVYWCGGNEKTGTCLNQNPRGDFFVDYVLSGLVSGMDPTRPFRRQSPCAITEIGNDLTSGDSHYCSFDSSLGNDNDGQPAILRYRELISRHITGFLSENAFFGPDSVETNRKKFPADKLWPINEDWAARMLNNPYDGNGAVPFAYRMDRHIREMYGAADSIESFVAKGMMLHAEILRAESEWVRAHEPMTGGFMNWMYSDIWPCGTWAIVDYYTEPKQVYYQAKRSFRPILATFIENEKCNTELAVINDSGASISVCVTYGKRTLSGRTLEEVTRRVDLSHGEAYRETVPFSVDGNDTYLYAIWDNGERTDKTLYSAVFWRGTDFEGRYTYETEYVSDTCVRVHIAAQSFVKSLFIHLPDNYKYTYSDNYLDLEAGETTVVTITCDEPFNADQVRLSDYAAMTAPRVETAVG